MSKSRSGSCRVRGVLRARGVLFLLAVTWLISPATPARAEVTAEQVIAAIERGRDFLLRDQNADGSWDDHAIAHGGISALATLALINSGLEPDDPAIQRALGHLRKPETFRPKSTYAIALQTMVFAAASPIEDRQRLRENVDWLEQTQIKDRNAGMWAYGERRGGAGDNSNTQYAMLALRDAEEAGITVNPNTWRLAERHWRNAQAQNGGWAYGGAGRGISGSMTVAGIASTIIARGKLHDSKEKIVNGKPQDCGQHVKNDSLEKALDWMGKNFSVHRNPGDSGWLLYYLYGLERAGRLSGQRFFYGPRNQKYDWYRQGAEHLVDVQDKLTGAWRGQGFEDRATVGTSLALLFLSKGLAPVVFNKLMHGPGDDWNNDRNDIRNLTNTLSKLDGWPRLLSWQIVDAEAATVEDLLEAPIGYFNGHEAPEFSDAEIAVLRDYVGQGGFLFAEACCSRPEFDQGFRALAERLYPEAEYRLKRLSPDHPVWRAYHLLDPQSSVPLWGIDVGCRTAIIYSPQDLSCFWEQAGGREAKDLDVQPMIEKALSVGTNIVAYATGRELDLRLTTREIIRDEGQDERIRRGFLQIAKIRFAGGNWDAAPKALRNLHIALREAVHLDVVTQQKNIAILDPVLFNHPLIFMHGRSAFSLSDEEKAKLRQYLQFGGTLMADACCGSEAFDRSFRQLLEDLFPDQPPGRIPPNHAMFTTQTGYDLGQVKRKEPQRAGPNEKLENVVRTVEPFLEGIELDGRYAVIYSKYDISCALERQASVECRGYVHEDAVKIGINIVLYALAP